MELSVLCILGGRSFLPDGSSCGTAAARHRGLLPATRKLGARVRLITSERDGRDTLSAESTLQGRWVPGPEKKEQEEAIWPRLDSYKEASHSVT